MSVFEDRRRSPRIEMLNRVHGQVTSSETPLTVREISLGGMSLQTGVPLEIGAVLEFRLTLGDGSTVPLTARVLRSVRVSAAGEPPVFVSGVQFLGDDGDDDSVGGLIGRFA